MTILFCGTSAADFELTGTPTITTTAAQKGTYVSEGFSFLSGTEVTGAFAQFDAAAELWTTIDACPSNATTSFFGYTLVEWGNAAYSKSQALFRLRSATGSLLYLEYWNGTAWVTGPSISGFYGTTTKAKFDTHIKMDDSAGIFEVYKDGILAASVTITDTILTTATTLDYIRIKNTHSSSSYTTYVSAIIVATTDTRSMVLAQNLPTAAGANSGWTGAYSTVDETGFDDTDLISTTTVGAASTFTFAALATALTGGAYAVEAVAVSGRVASGVNSGKKVTGAIYTNSGTYQGESMDALPTLNRGQAIFSVNPATGVAFTAAEASSAQVGVKAVAA